MLQPVCLLMHFIPFVTQDLVQEQFQQAVVAHGFQGHPFTLRRKRGATMLLVFQQRRLGSRQLLQHPRDRGRGDIQVFSQGIGGGAALVVGQFVNGFKVVLNGLR